MMLDVLPPSESDTRSALADWMELQALIDSRLRATSGTLSNVLDIPEEGFEEHELIVDPETGDELEVEILGERRSALIANVFEELASRQAMLGSAYPFEV